MNEFRGLIGPERAQGALGDACSANVTFSGLTVSDDVVDVVLCCVVLYVVRKSPHIFFADPVNSVGGPIDV